MHGELCHGRGRASFWDKRQQLQVGKTAGEKVVTSCSVKNILGPSLPKDAHSSRGFMVQVRRPGPSFKLSPPGLTMLSDLELEQ